jgi:hypothetical protein
VTPELKAPASVEELEEQLYSHIVSCIDFDRVSGLEQMLWGLLDDLGISDDDQVADMSTEMVARAFTRAGQDPNNRMSDVPFGITEAEASAANFDPSCPFCVYEEAESRRPAEHDHTEACALCDEAAREWRRQHAEALKRRRLA